MTKGKKQMATWTMKMERKYIIRRRWAFVLALVLAVLALMVLYYVSTRIWWVEGQGYCFDTMDKCFPELFGN
jgi:membrane protein YdbS with pleckstrin-like domain